jgi:hypothetical protein
MQRFPVWMLGVMVVLSLSYSAQARPGEAVEPARTVAGAVAGAPKLPASMKKKAQEDNAKPKAKKKPVAKRAAKKVPAKPPTPKAKKHALGLKGAMLPFNDMNVTRPGVASGDTREIDYDFGVIWGLGVQYQYRLARNFYACGEFLYWFPHVSDTSNHPEAVATQENYRERDVLVNLGAGLRYDILGGETTNDRVYLKGHAGFADYSGNDANLDNSNRAGLYFNLGVGIEHMFARTFTVFADGGYFYNAFLSPGDNEEDASLQGIVINAGFLFHWGN